MERRGAAAAEELESSWLREADSRGGEVVEANIAPCTPSAHTELR